MKEKCKWIQIYVVIRLTMNESAQVKVEPYQWGTLLIESLDTSHIHDSIPLAHF